jgi:methyltransferase (TIGR00027 family)
MQFDSPDIDLLATTACWTAAIRAQESERADRLFDDPLAATLAGREGAAWLERMTGVSGSDSNDSVNIRTRFFDDFLQRVTNNYPVRQVVLVAAGMDARAFRLEWPEGTVLYELDRPGLQERKAQRLASVGAKPTCDYRMVGVDLEDSWAEALSSAGFDASQRSAWLMEGLLFYLPESSALRLIDEVTALAAPESWLGLDVFNREMLVSPWTQAWREALERAGVPWLSAVDEPETVLAERGWTATVLQPGEEGANFGRWPYPVAPRDMPGFPRSFLVTAQKRK